MYSDSISYISSDLYSYNTVMHDVCSVCSCLMFTNNILFYSTVTVQLQNQTGVIYNC